jgi:ABC-2 type transport system ATP-binding protein
MSKEIITIRNLSKTFYYNKKIRLKHFFINGLSSLKGTKVEALKKINISIKKGDFVGIIGPNGAGKSSLLRMISKIYTPTNGFVKVLGKVAPFLELEAGFERDLTAKDNLYLYGSFLGMNRLQINKLYIKIVDFAQLNNQMQKQFKHLSSGNKMRLGFSITVHSNTDIFLIDEAFSVADENFQKKALNKLLALNKKGKTILFVSHDLNFVKKYCQSVYWIESGRIRMKGKTNEVIYEYKKSV